MSCNHTKHVYIGFCRDWQPRENWLKQDEPLHNCQSCAKKIDGNNLTEKQT